MSHQEQAQLEEAEKPQESHPHNNHNNHLILNDNHNNHNNNLCVPKMFPGKPTQVWIFQKHSTLLQRTGVALSVRTVNIVALCMILKIGKKSLRVSSYVQAIHHLIIPPTQIEFKLTAHARSRIVKNIFSALAAATGKRRIRYCFTSAPIRSLTMIFDTTSVRISVRCLNLMTLARESARLTRTSSRSSLRQILYASVILDRHDLPESQPQQGW